VSDEGLPGGQGAAGSSEESVADVAALYLGNILYALEVTALSLDEQQKPADAAFYRGIARKLAEARGRERKGTV
jgi:hypothetical protein